MRDCRRVGVPDGLRAGLEAEDRFQPEARRSAAVGLGRAGRVTLGLGQTGGGADPQARVDAVIGSSLNVAEIALAADRLAEIEIQTPAAALCEPQARGTGLGRSGAGG